MFIFLQSYVLQTTPTVRQMKHVCHRAGGVMEKLIAQPEKTREYTVVSKCIKKQSVIVFLHKFVAVLMTFKF